MKSVGLGFQKLEQQLTDRETDRQSKNEALRSTAGYEIL